MNSELSASPPFAMADAPNTEVPMSAPPAMSKMVVIFVFSPNPIPNDTKNKIIVDSTKYHSSLALIGKKPCLLPCVTGASAMYVSNNTIATIASISEILFLLIFVCKYILVYDNIINGRLYNLCNYNTVE